MRVRAMPMQGQNDCTRYTRLSEEVYLISQKKKKTLGSCSPSQITELHQRIGYGGPCNTKSSEFVVV